MKLISSAASSCTRGHLTAWTRTVGAVLGEMPEADMQAPKLYFPNTKDAHYKYANFPKVRVLCQRRWVAYPGGLSVVSLQATV